MRSQELLLLDDSFLGVSFLMSEINKCDDFIVIIRYDLTTRGSSWAYVVNILTNCFTVQ
jgi:hypothetical protein